MTSADVIKFQDEIPIQYPSFIVNELEGVTLAKKLGNERGVLPFTVIIQPDGSVKKSFYFGPISALHFFRLTREGCYFGGSVPIGLCTACSSPWMAFAPASPSHII